MKQHHALEMPHTNREFNGTLEAKSESNFRCGKFFKCRSTRLETSCQPKALDSSKASTFHVPTRLMYDAIKFMAVSLRGFHFAFTRCRMRR